MKRRNFLKLSGTVSTVPFLLNGIPVSTRITKSMLSMLQCVPFNERVLVLIEMAGGNDGLNTIVPIDQYSLYANHRPTIRLPDSGPNALQVLNPGDAAEDQVALHPAMTGIKQLYNQNKVAIIQGVSYPQYNLSHFKSTDLWLSAGDGTPANYNIPSGWMGRYLDSAYPGVAGNPTPGMEDPLGIQVGNPKPSLGFHTVSEHQPAISLGWNNPNGYYNLVNEIGADEITGLPASDYANEMGFIMEVENSVELYAQRIQNVFSMGSNTQTYPSTGVAYQLKTIARLISGGSQTKIFLVSDGGYDTHEQQTEVGDSTTGWHADLLTELSEGIKTFYDDLEAQGLDGKVMMSTFSEFGRQPIENVTRGTDHGNVAPMFVIGNAVNQGVKGTNLDLANLNGDQLQGMQYDYREIYSSLMKDWFGASPAVLNNVLPGDFDNGLSLIETDPNQGPDCFVDAVLPVVITAFKAEKHGENAVRLEWKAESELNFSHYEIEKSIDQQSFYKIEEVPAKSYLSGLKVYDHIDHEPHLGMNYYRLKMVDDDKSYKFSSIQSVKFDAASIKNIKVYPNPAVYDVRIAITAKSAFVGRIKLFDIHGTMLVDQEAVAKKGFNKYLIDLSNINPGEYIISLTSRESGISYTQKLMVLSS